MNFTTKSAKTMVVVATAGAAILSSMEQVSTGKMPSVKIGVGAVIVGAVLYALTDISPALAGALAALLLVGAALTNGTAVAATISSATK